MRPAYIPTAAEHAAFLATTLDACAIDSHHDFQVDKVWHQAYCLLCFALSEPVGMLKPMGEHQNGGERTETQDLAEAPATLETLNGKLNHLIIVIANVERLCLRAVETADEAKSIAGKSRSAALRASGSALAVIQDTQPLSRRAGLGALFAGAAVGVAIVQLMLSGLIAAVMSSCGH